MDEAATPVPCILPFGAVDICVYNDEKIRWGLAKAGCDYSAEDALLA